MGAKNILYSGGMKTAGFSSGGAADPPRLGGGKGQRVLTKADKKSSASPKTGGSDSESKNNKLYKG